MKLNKILGYLGTSALLGLAFLLYFVPSFPEAFATSSSSFTTSTTSTPSVIGYAIPNATTLNDGVVAFILPIFVMSLFVLIAGYMDLDGEINSFVIKLSLLIGCLLGMLSLTAVAATSITIAFPVVAGIYLITYVWKKV